MDVEHEGALRSVRIKDQLNGISSAGIVFDSSEVKVSEKGQIKLGSEVSIHLGYKDEVEEVFSGEATGLRKVLSEGGGEEIEVEVSNVLHRLAHGVHSRSFEEKGVSDIIKGIIEGYSLQAEVEGFGSSQAFASEDEQSDYEYVIKNANGYGKQVYATGNTIYVGSEISVREDEIIYEWGKSLIRFDGEQNIRGLVSGIGYLGWDPLKNESFIGEASLTDIEVKVGGGKDWTGVSKGGKGNYEEVRINQNIKDAEDAKRLAIGTLQKNSYRFSKAAGGGEGNYKLRPGMRVTIKMTGESFDGEYIAWDVTHCFDYREGYKTAFTLKRNMVS
jgi:phage protein D